MKLNEYLNNLMEESGAMPGASAGGPNAPMSTESIGKPSNYVGTLQRDGSHKGVQKKKKRSKKKQVMQNPEDMNAARGLFPSPQRRPVM